MSDSIMGKNGKLYVLRMPATDGIPEAPNDGNFYARRNEQWIKIAEKTKTLVEDYPVDSVEEFVCNFNGAIYKKVTVNTTDTMNIYIYNYTAGEYVVDEDEIRTTKVYTITTDDEYEIHAKGNGNITSIIVEAV